MPPKAKPPPASKAAKPPDKLLVYRRSCVLTRIANSGILESMKRDYTLMIRMTQAERVTLLEAAAFEPLSSWARRVLLAATQVKEVKK